jgi:hypothetical protein
MTAAVPANRPGGVGSNRTPPRDLLQCARRWPRMVWRRH